jgi:hypothetical protein
VTSLMLEHFGVPSSAQDMRLREEHVGGIVHVRPAIAAR